MPVFPPPAAVTVIVDGRPLPAYAGAYLRNGRVYAPLDPVLLRLADRLWVEGTALVIERDGRRLRIPLQRASSEEPAIDYVAVGPLLRALGDRVTYRGSAHVLEVETPSMQPAVTPTPFVAGQRLPLRPVFTPEPVVTPKPVWTGPPVPRRTPLPAPTGT